MGLCRIGRAGQDRIGLSWIRQGRIIQDRKGPDRELRIRKSNDDQGDARHKVSGN